jgi:hypothetical protein
MLWKASCREKHYVVKSVPVNKLVRGIFTLILIVNKTIVSIFVDDTTGYEIIW